MNSSSFEIIGSNKNKNDQKSYFKFMLEASRKAVRFKNWKIGVYYYINGIDYLDGCFIGLMERDGIFESTIYQRIGNLQDWEIL
jgi:hypothetical protein